MAAAGGVLVQVLRLLPSVPRSSLTALGLALEPLHQHGVSAEEGERLSDGAAAANESADFQGVVLPAVWIWGA